MNVTNALIRNSVTGFAVFFGFMVLAFWPSYFSRLLAQQSYHAHAHGIAMVLWCILLIAQAWLIRTGQRKLHRAVGKLSFALVPIIVLTTVNFIHFRLSDIPVPQLPSAAFYVLALILNALVAFVILYALAIHHRDNAPLHARYMASTIFPLFTPVTDRLIGAHWPSLVPLVPRIDGAPVLPVVGFILADAILILLVILDWRSKRRLNAFPIALAVLLAYHASVLTLHDIAAWRSFCSWFMNLPLS